MSRKDEWRPIETISESAHGIVLVWVPSRKMAFQVCHGRATGPRSAAGNRLYSESDLEYWTLELSGEAATHWRPLPAGPGEEAPEWAIVEIFGHRQHAGRIRREGKLGIEMLRIEVPKDGGWETHWYAPGAVFSITASDEKAVVEANYVPSFDPPDAIFVPSDPDDDEDTDRPW